jgi:hypothetical protein
MEKQPTSVCAKRCDEVKNDGKAKEGRVRTEEQLTRKEDEMADKFTHSTQLSLNTTHKMP